MKLKEELKELKTKSNAELLKQLASGREHLRDLRFKASQNQLKNVREMRIVRKKISRINTLLNQNKVSK